MFTGFLVLNSPSPPHRFTSVGVLKHNICHNNNRRVEKFRAEIEVSFGTINENMFAATIVRPVIRFQEVRGCYLVVVIVLKNIT
jgi:hypothetical protein